MDIQRDSRCVANIVGNLVILPFASVTDVLPEYYIEFVVHEGMTAHLSPLTPTLWVETLKKYQKFYFYFIDFHNILNLRTAQPEPLFLFSAENDRLLCERWKRSSVNRLS
jgi:hypothetical protein